MKKKFEYFHRNPEKFIPVDEIGDLCLEWFFDRYVALRMLKNMYLFDRAFQLLTESGNFSSKNSFGEMHCDGYMWVEKHDGDARDDGYLLSMSSLIPSYTKVDRANMRSLNAVKSMEFWEHYLDNPSDLE